MTISATDVPAYTDLKGLSALKRGVANQDPAAIRKVAQQFESLFTRMMLKSMRDAVGTDPIFGSDQEQMYQSMADDQLSVQLSKGKGMGLADMLIRQLQKLGVPGAAAAAQKTASSIGAVGARGAAVYAAVQGQSPAQSTPASPAVQSHFIQGLWPDAQQAAQQLGVDPRSLLAQAALETNWGRSLPQDAAGQSSNNLFGVKVGAAWTGPAVNAGTREYEDGSASPTTARFRSYASPGASFQDYVALLRANPRYSGALNTGSDVRAFATGLQRGGYATDPDYVQKLSAMAQNVAGAMAQNVAGAPAANPAVTDLKSASLMPITPETGAL